MKTNMTHKLAAGILCFVLALSLALIYPKQAIAWDPDPALQEEGCGSGRDYILVSISKQHVYHYKGGEIHCESDCVTGTQGQKDTPLGSFKITEKIPGTYLKPKGGTPVWVNRWMRITSDGVGLHDAPWRSAFGGGIYTARGSHGCINLPSDFAYRLYTEVHVGYPVTIVP